MNEIVAISVAVIALIFAGLSWRNSRQTTLYQIINDLMKDYRSPQMYCAVKTLWHFYHHCADNKLALAEEYDRRRKEDDEWVSKLDKRERMEAEQSTLHYQRRLVSHFYQYIATLYVKKILPGSIVFNNWSKDDLKLIPDIIIPIENKILQTLRPTPLPQLEKNHKLSVLYRDSLNW